MLYRSVIDDSRIIINLASKEYSKCIEKYLTSQDRYITIQQVEVQLLLLLIVKLVNQLMLHNLLVLKQI